MIPYNATRVKLCNIQNDALRVDLLPGTLLYQQTQTPNYAFI